MNEKADLPMASPDVTLVEVTADSVRDICSLKVAPEQQGFVAPNAFSIAEAYFEKGAWFRAIAADGAPVGFVMLYDPTVPGASLDEDIEQGDILLWRYMVDHRHQRRGIGRQALDLIVAEARSRPGAKRLLSSYVPGEGGPRDFYLGYGFTETGEMDPDGEEVMIAYPL